MRRVNLIPLPVLYVTILTALACGNATDPLDVPPEVIDLSGRWIGDLNIRAFGIEFTMAGMASIALGETICPITMDLAMSGDQVFAGNYTLNPQVNCGVVNTRNDQWPSLMNFSPNVLPPSGSIREGQLGTLVRLDRGESCVASTTNGPDYSRCSYELHFRIDLGSDADSPDLATCTVNSLLDGSPPPVELGFQGAAVLVWGGRRHDVYDPNHPLLAGSAFVTAACQEQRISLEIGWQFERFW